MVKTRKENYDKRYIGKRRPHGRYMVIRTEKGWESEHRVVMEKHLGRKLSTKEHVHHKNHDRRDNRLENLEVILASPHASLHAKERDHLRPFRFHPLKAGQWSKNHDQCVTCGRTKIKHAAKGMCASCYVKMKREENRKG